MAKEPSHIWYVSYGSNLRRERFMSYINGGFAPGGLTPQLGCTDKTPPLRDEAIEIPYGLYFGNMISRVWGGAPAFVTQAPGAQPTKARAYLITADQFWEIVQDENHLKAPVTRQPLESVITHGSLVLQDVTNSNSNYNRLIYCGEQDGHPMLSFTSARDDSKIEITAPSEIYIKTMAIGLRQSHRMTPEQTAAYLVAVPGIAGNYSLPELTSLCGARSTPTL